MQRNLGSFSEEKVMQKLNELLRKMDMEGITNVLHCAIEQHRHAQKEGVNPLWDEPYSDTDPTIAQWLAEAEKRAEQDRGQ